VPNSSNAFAIQAWLEWLMRRLGGAGAVAEQVEMLDPVQLPRVDAFNLQQAISAIETLTTWIDKANGKIYAATDTPNIAVLDLDLNQLDTINMSEQATALAVTQGKIIYRSSTGKIYIIDVSTKTETQLADLGTPIEQILKPVITSTRMYVRGTSNLVYIDSWEPYLPVVLVSDTPQL